MSAQEPEHLCTACGGAGYATAWAIGDTCCPGDLCEHCDGSGQEPCPPKGDLERALRRAEFRARDGHGRERGTTTMIDGMTIRPVHEYTDRALERRAARARLASQLVADWQLDADRAMSIAAVVSVDGSVLRLSWLACVLPLPTHAERVSAAEMLLTSCGYR